MTNPQEETVMRGQDPARPGDRGFTLVELLIVIVVLGILSGIVLFGVARYRSDVVLAACKADLATVAVAADAYDARTGGYPATVAVLGTGGYLNSTPSGLYAFDGTAKTVTRSPACSDGTDGAGTPTATVYYANCTAARAAGAAPIRRGEPGYRAALDRDGDGVACE
jgi:general secretion pathway protein G